MTPNEAVQELSRFQQEVAEIKRDIQTMSPSVDLLFRRAPLRAQGAKLDDAYGRFISLDREIGAGTTVPDNINEKLAVAATLSILNGARESVRTLLGESYHDITALRSQLNFNASLLVAVLALLVSVVGVLA